MLAWQETRLRALRAARDEMAVFDVATAMAREMGFACCAYAMRMPLPMSHPKIFAVNNYRPDWQGRGVLEGYLQPGADVPPGRDLVMPLLWDDDAGGPARGLWDDARAHGLHAGWAQASHDAHGIGGLLTLARAADTVSESELDAKLARMTWLAQAVHTEMARHLVPKLMPEAACPLSSREVEVLRWTGDGKTASDIADILSLSRHTVNFHIKNALLKLNASNKTAGVVKAAMMGLI